MTSTVDGVLAMVAVGCDLQLVLARRMLRSCATTRGWWAQPWTAASSHASGEGLQAATGAPTSSSSSSSRKRYLAAR
jgi:hypothetical protein